MAEYPKRVEQKIEAKDGGIVRDVTQVIVGNLAPVVAHLGGAPAVAETFHAIRWAGKRWP